jgi:chemotaxis signal transduction protein
MDTGGTMGRNGALWRTQEQTEAATHGAMRQLVVFAIDEQRYALPLGAVLRVLPMVALSPLPQAPPITLGVFNLRGTVIPVLDIRRRFGCNPCDYRVSAHLLVARTALHARAGRTTRPAACRRHLTTVRRGTRP